MANNRISLRQANRNWITTWSGLILCGSKCGCVHFKSLSCDLVCGMSYISLVPRPIISHREINLVLTVRACTKYPTIWYIYLCALLVHEIESEDVFIPTYKLCTNFYQWNRSLFIHSILYLIATHVLSLLQEDRKKEREDERKNLEVSEKDNHTQFLFLITCIWLTIIISIYDW